MAQLSSSPDLKNAFAGPGKVTQAQIAARLGVATSTVQRALDGSPRISPRMRQRVQQVAAEMGYEHNVMARGLRSGRTMTLGVVLGRFERSHMAVFAGIEEEASRHGYSAMLAFSDFDPATEQLRVKQFVDRVVDGLIVASINAKAPFYGTLVRQGRPVVFSHPAPVPSVGPVICGHERKAMADITRYVLGLGHRRIGVISASHNWPSSLPDPPLEGYKDALAEASIDYVPDLVFKATARTSQFGRDRFYVYENGVEGLHALMSRDAAPTAVICDGDALAAGAIAAAHDRKLAIPDDLSLAVADGGDLCALLTPQVTAMTYPRKALGQMLATQLLTLLNDPASEWPAQTYLDAELVARQSTRALR